MSQPADQNAIVVAVDFSEMTDFVIEAAARQAPVFAPAVLHATCILDESPDTPEHEAAHAGELGSLEEALRARLAARLEGRGLSVEVHARLGPPAEEILALATELKAELIVLGRHGEGGLRPGFLGSVPARCLKDAPCDVLVVQSEDYPEG